MWSYVGTCAALQPRGKLNEVLGRLATRMLMLTLLCVRQAFFLDHMLQVLRPSFTRALWLIAFFVASAAFTFPPTRRARLRCRNVLLAARPSKSSRLHPRG